MAFVNDRKLGAIATVVGGSGLLAFLKSYGSTADADLSKADFNTDGQINDTDLTAMLGAL